MRYAIHIAQRHPRALLAAAALTLFVVVAGSATLTPFPLVLSDEANYLLPTLYGYHESHFERWAILARIPVHLFHALYGTLAGPDMYLRAKLVNAALVAASAFPLFAIARRYLPTGEAVALAAVGVAMPVTSYARYFMPESLYFLGWCVVLLCIVRTLARPSWVTAAVAGVALATLSLVKPHALALAVAVAAFLVLRPEPWLRRGLAVTLLAIVFVTCRVALTYAMTGRLEASLSGPSYAAMLGGAIAPSAVLANGLGHVAALTLLAGVPLFVLGGVLRGRSASAPAARELALLAACMLAALIAMTVVFSAGVHGLAPDSERITRLHGRYYAFALPLVMIAYAAAARDARVPSSAALCAWAGVALAAWLLLAARYETGFVDYADLSVITRWPLGLWPLAAGIATCALVARWGGGLATAPVRRALPIAWWAAVGVTTSLTLQAAPLAGKAFKANDVDRAMTSDALRGLHGRSDVMVVGTTAVAPDTFRVLFHLASLARARLVAPGTTLTRADVPPDVEALILLPGVDFDGPAEAARVGPVTRVRP